MLIFQLSANTDVYLKKSKRDYAKSPDRPFEILPAVRNRIFAVIMLYPET